MQERWWAGEQLACLFAVLPLLASMWSPRCGHVCHCACALPFSSLVSHKRDTVVLATALVSEVWTMHLLCSFAALSSLPAVHPRNRALGASDDAEHHRGEPLPLSESLSHMAQAGSSLLQGKT